MDPAWRGSQLTNIRVIFTSFVNGAVIFGVVSVFLVASAKRPPRSETGFAIVIVCIGLLLLVAAEKLPPSLDASSEEALSRSYRGRAIIRFAIAEGATLNMITGFLVSTLWWMALIALVVGLVGLGRAAPSQQALQRDQEALQAQGSALSLFGRVRAVR